MLVTLRSFPLSPKFQPPGNSGTIRVYYSKSLVSDGVSVQGSPPNSKHFFDEIPWSLVNGIITTDDFASLISTTNSSEPDARVVGVLYFGNTKVMPNGFIFNWKVPHTSGSIVSKETLDIYNRQRVRFPRPGTLDADQIINFILSTLNLALSASLLIPRAVGTVLLVNGTAEVFSPYTTANAPIFLTAQDGLTSGDPKVISRVTGDPAEDRKFVIDTGFPGDEGVVAWAIYAAS